MEGLSCRRLADRLHEKWLRLKVRACARGGQIPPRRILIPPRRAESSMVNREALGLIGVGGEGGIRTLGALLELGALAKLCFRPLSHLTKQGPRVEIFGELR